LTPNKIKNNRAASSAKAQKGKKGSGGRSITTSVVPKYNTTIRSGNDFSISNRAFAGRDATVLKGKMILCDVYYPSVSDLALDSQKSSLTFQVCNVLMHPTQWNCNRLLNQFTSYIRWKPIKLSMKFIPNQGTLATGQIVMGFSSCVQDGGPSGAGMALKAAITDLPGSLVVPMGQAQAQKVHMPFINAFDWNFTCRSGNVVNEIYCGVFVAALSGSRSDFIGPDKIGAMIGSFELSYEIALAEPASLLNFTVPEYQIKYMTEYMNPTASTTHSPFITTATNRRAADAHSGVQVGDILQATWSHPTPKSGSGALANFLFHFSNEIGQTGSLIPSRMVPREGQTIYGKVMQLDPTSSAAVWIMWFADLKSAIAANPKKATELRDNDLENVLRVTLANGANIPTTSWSTMLLDTAKVILPAMIQSAVSVLL